MVYRPIELHELIDALREHEGLEDVPVNTIKKNEDIIGFSMTILDYARRIEAGDSIYQYIIESVPDWIKARQKIKAPEGTISLEKVAAIKATKKNTIKNKIANDELNAIKKGNRWYVYTDDKFDNWITNVKDPNSIYKRMLFLQDALDLYTGSDIDEVYQLADEMEKKFNPGMHGRHSKKNIKQHVNEYFDSNIPNDINILRQFIEHYVNSVREEKENLMAD